MEDLDVQPGIVIPASDLTWTAVRASGAGGQHVNKTATQVELRFDVEGTRALSPSVKARLRGIAGPRVDGHGRILIESQDTRSQARNLEDARQKLAELVRAALIVPKTRRPTKPSKAAKRRTLQSKAKRAEIKRARRRVRPDDG